jgi:hypothetical protein
MISGIVELLTPRRAAGWVYEDNDLKATLDFRVRHGATILTQIQMTQGASQDLAISSAGDSRARYFSFQFAKPLGRIPLRELTIEAAVAGSDSWRPLPRHLKVGPLLPEIDPPAGKDLAFQSQHVEGTNRDTDFWSNDTAQEAPGALESRPVFVLGAARSGTSAISVALEKGTRYKGFPEGHVLDISIRIAHAVNMHFEKKDQWIQPNTCASYHLGQIGHAWLREETIALIRRMAGGYTTPFWFDKTPTYQMVASAPILAEVWPHARFIYMKRRGLEVLRSRIRKFAIPNFAGNCRDWNIIMASWRAVREMVPGRFVELDQRTLAVSPDSAAASVGKLLSLDPPEIEAFASILQNEQPEATGPASSIAADISELGWSAEQIETFQEICGAEMDAYGYTYDANYCSQAAE